VARRVWLLVARFGPWPCPLDRPEVREPCGDPGPSTMRGLRL